MKKNWKCVIGAVFLTPVCLAALFALLVGFTWVVKEIFILQVVLGAISVGFTTLIVWFALYEHCKDHWLKKSNKAIHSDRQTDGGR